MPTTASRFDTADYLETNADIGAYLEASAADGNPTQMTAALGVVTRARNASELAHDTGVVGDVL